MKKINWSSLIVLFALGLGPASASADKRELDSQGWYSYEEMRQPARSAAGDSEVSKDSRKRELDSQGWYSYEETRSASPGKPKEPADKSVDKREPASRAKEILKRDPDQILFRSL